MLLHLDTLLRSSKVSFQHVISIDIDGAQENRKPIEARAANAVPQRDTAHVAMRGDQGFATKREAEPDGSTEFDPDLCGFKKRELASAGEPHRKPCQALNM